MKKILLKSGACALYENIIYVIKSLNMERKWEIFLIHACIYLYNEFDCPKRKKNYEVWIPGFHTKLFNK